jgi:hypothetical protein
MKMADPAKWWGPSDYICKLYGKCGVRIAQMAKTDNSFNGDVFYGDACIGSTLCSETYEYSTTHRRRCTSPLCRTLQET